MKKSKVGQDKKYSTILSIHRINVDEFLRVLKKLLDDPFFVSFLFRQFAAKFYY